jgi:AcrR family transcriptional regulator
MIDSLATSAASAAASHSTGVPSESTCQPLDPRIRRTRELLQQALDKLLETNEFEKISVQDITDAATVNRATFYAHYPDKFALLECLVAKRFHQLLDQRGVYFDGACVSAIRGIILGVCDYLTQNWNHPPGSDGERQRLLAPHLESAVVNVVQQMLLEGLLRHPTPSPVSPEIQASATSWAIFGAAKQWLRTPNRVPSEAVATTIMALLAPILTGQPAPAPE